MAGKQHRTSSVIMTASTNKGVRTGRAMQTETQIQNNNDRNAPVNMVMQESQLLPDGPWRSFFGARFIKGR